MCRRVVQEASHNKWLGWILRSILSAKNHRRSLRHMNYPKKVFDKVVSWDRNLAKKFQDKFSLTDYQMLCLSFAKGIIIGAIFL